MLAALFNNARNQFCLCNHRSLLVYHCSVTDIRLLRRALYCADGGMRPVWPRDFWHHPCAFLRAAFFKILCLTVCCNGVMLSIRFLISGNLKACRNRLNASGHFNQKTHHAQSFLAKAAAFSSRSSHRASSASTQTAPSWMHGSSTNAPPAMPHGTGQSSNAGPVSKLPRTKWRHCKATAQSMSEKLPSINQACLQWLHQMNAKQRSLFTNKP